MDWWFQRCYSTVTLTSDPKLWSVHLCPIKHRSCKFGENVSNNLQDIVLTMFWDAHTDARTHGRTGQNGYASGHTTLGGGIKTTCKMQSNGCKKDLATRSLNTTLSKTRPECEAEQAMGHWNWPMTHWPIWYVTHDPSDMTHDPSHLMLETCR